MLRKGSEGSKLARRLEHQSAKDLAMAASGAPDAAGGGLTHAS